MVEKKQFNVQWFVDLFFRARSEPTALIKSFVGVIADHEGAGA